MSDKTTVSSTTTAVIQSLDDIRANYISNLANNTNIVSDISKQAVNQQNKENALLAAEVDRNTMGFINLINGTEENKGRLYTMNTEAKKNSLISEVDAQIKDIQGFIDKGKLTRTNPSLETLINLKQVINDTWSTNQELMTLPEVFSKFESNWENTVKTTIAQDPSTDIGTLVNMLKSNIDSEIEVNHLQSDQLVKRFTVKLEEDMRNLYNAISYYDLVPVGERFVNTPTGEFIEQTNYDSSTPIKNIEVLNVLNSMDIDSLSPKDAKLKDFLSSQDSTSLNNNFMTVGDLSNNVLTEAMNIPYNLPLKTEKVPINQVKTIYDFGLSEDELRSSSQSEIELKRKIATLINSGDWHKLEDMDKRLESKIVSIQGKTLVDQKNFNEENYKQFEESVDGLMSIDDRNPYVLNSVAELKDIQKVMNQIKITGGNIMSEFQRLTNNQYGQDTFAYQLFSGWNDFSNSVRDTDRSGLRTIYNERIETMVNSKIGPRVNLIYGIDVQDDLQTVHRLLSKWNADATGSKTTLRQKDGTTTAYDGKDSPFYNVLSKDFLETTYKSLLGAKPVYDYNLSTSAGVFTYDKNNNLDSTLNTFIDDFTKGLTNINKGGVPDNFTAIQNAFEAFKDNSGITPNSIEDYDAAIEQLDKITELFNENKSVIPVFGDTKEDFGEDMITLSWHWRQLIGAGTANAQAVGSRIVDAIEIIKAMYTAQYKIKKLNGAVEVQKKGAVVPTGESTGQDSGFLGK